MVTYYLSFASEACSYNSLRYNKNTSYRAFFLGNALHLLALLYYVLIIHILSPNRTTLYMHVY